MSNDYDNHERIWLEPVEPVDPVDGRQWCRYNAWGDGVEYIRADLVPQQPQPHDDSKQANSYNPDANIIAGDNPALQPHAVVKPLEWKLSWGPDDDGDECHVAGTPFGSFTVERIDGQWRWGYCFDEYYDEDRHDCEDLESGKAAAQSHWNERLTPFIALAEQEGNHD